MGQKLKQMFVLEKLFGERLVFGALAVIMGTIIGATGMAAAAPVNNSNSNQQGPQNIMMCNNKQDLMKFGFGSGKNASKNCQNWFNKHHHGSGYGNQGKHHKKHHKFNFGFFFHWWGSFFGKH